MTNARSMSANVQVERSGKRNLRIWLFAKVAGVSLMVFVLLYCTWSASVGTAISAIGNTNALCCPNLCVRCRSKRDQALRAEDGGRLQQEHVSALRTKPRRKPPRARYAHWARNVLQERWQERAKPAGRFRSQMVPRLFRSVLEPLVHDMWRALQFCWI